MDACLEKFNPSQLNGCLTVDKRPSFLSVFTEAVEKNPSKEAIIFHDDNGLTKSISFQRFNDASSRIANFLKRYHDSKKLGSKVIGVALKPSEQLPVILLAILKAGMTYLPLDLEAPHRRIKYILQEACPAICIIEDKETEKFSDADVLTSENLISGATLESNVVSSEIDDSKIALVLYTSGSTGFPKGVTLPYTALMNRLYWQWKELPYSPTEKYCVFKTALTFVDSICEIWGPLLQSRTLIVLPKHVIQNPEKFINVLKKYEIQRIVLVPSLLSTIMVFLRYQQDKKSLSSLNLWICSGETISTSLAKDFFTWFEDDNKTIANLYGSTEIMGDVTFYLINKNDIYLNKKTLPIGKPIDNCIVYVVDENLELVSYGETGEILVAGRNLATGYISSSSIQNKFIKNPFPSSQGYVKAFRTGDLARIENSLIFYEGRQDSQIKIRGQKIDLTEIDRAILEISSVEAVVTCCKIYEHQQIILSFIVLKNFNSNEEDIELHLKQTLLSYMMPKIILVQEFPLLTNGKVDRQKLLKSYESTDDQNQCDYSNVPNEYMKKAKVLFPLLSSVIGHHNKCISIRSNFYELGGNSLNSVYTVSKLREKGFNIGITDFITAESIMDILKKMKKGGSFNDDDINPNQYIIELLSDSHKNEVIKIITESFIAKADLERWLLPEIQEKDYNDFIECLWKPLLDKKFSFVIKSSLDDKILSVALNFDARDEPDIKINSKLSIIFDFLESLEQPVRDRHLPQGKNKIFHSFMMATDISLSSATNVILMRIMEQKCLEIANQNNFSGILTTNTSPLTQQLGTDIFNYEVMLNYQVNQYITSEGIKPFEQAPDSQRAIVSWKKID